MKNKILLMLFIVAANTSFAQESAKFGVRAGLSSAGLRGDAVSSLENLLDFTNGMVRVLIEPAILQAFMPTFNLAGIFLLNQQFITVRKAIN